METLQRDTLGRKLCEGEQRNPSPLPPHSLLPSFLKWQLSPRVSSYRNQPISACHQTWSHADYGPSSSRWVHVTAGSRRAQPHGHGRWAPCTEPWKQMLNKGVCTFLISASRTQKVPHENPYLSRPMRTHCLEGTLGSASSSLVPRMAVPARGSPLWTLSGGWRGMWSDARPRTSQQSGVGCPGLVSNSHLDVRTMPSQQRRPTAGHMVVKQPLGSTFAGVMLTKAGVGAIRGVCPLRELLPRIHRTFEPCSCSL